MRKVAGISFKGFYEFIPLIILWSVSKPSGMMVSLIACMIILIHKRLVNRLSRMTNASLILIMGINILYHKFEAAWVFENRTLISYCLLCFIYFASNIKNRPITMDLSSDSYCEVSKTPFFIEMNKIITSAFGISYLINMIWLLAGYPNQALISSISIGAAVFLSALLPSFMPRT